jgi:hypothetical protein
MPVVSSGQRPKSSPSSGFTSTQKSIFVLAAVLVGPSMLKKFYEKPASEKVDLSSFNIVSHYDTPAIEKMDNTLRIEFCSS